MNIQKSDIVISLNGRDQEKPFFVLDLDGEYALIADGKGRRLEKPKRKKLKHLRHAAASESRTAVKIRNGEKISNIELRRSLAEFSAGAAGVEGGM